MSEPEDQTLAVRMRNRIAEGRDDETTTATLTAHAESLEGITFDTPIPVFVGRWAKARRFWCELTGEALV